MSDPDTGGRYTPDWLHRCVESGRLHWIAHCGAYDLWYDCSFGTFVTVNDAGQHTDFEWDGQGNLTISDRDTDQGVRPELHDMCLIYAAAQRFEQDRKE